MTFTDPVCGAEVKPDSAYAIEPRGFLALHFCSDACHQQYLANPSRYASHDDDDSQHVFTNDDEPVAPQQWRDDGDLEGPPTKR